MPSKLSALSPDTNPLDTHHVYVERGASDEVKVLIPKLRNTFSFKQSVVLATESNDTLSGLAARDGVTPVAGERVLVKAQTAGSANGIYIAAAGAWTRATDFDTGAKALGTVVIVEEGTANADKLFRLTTNAPITIGSTSLTFTEVRQTAITNAELAGSIALSKLLTPPEANATADQTNAEIKTAYEANADTNEFDDAEQTKLAGIATGAEVNPDLISQAEAEAGTATTERIFSALRAKQAILAKSVGTISIIIDGGGSVLTTGIKGDLEIPFACTIDRVTMLADQSGSVVVDIWKDTYALYPPTNADSITASAVPTITTAVKSQDSTLTGWTTAIAAGDTLRFNVDSVTTIQRVIISLKVTKT